MTSTLQEAPATGPLPGLLATLQRQLATKVDLIANTRRVSFVSDDDGDLGHEGLPLVIDLPEGAEAFSVNRYAHQQIAETVSVPWKLYERLLGAHPDLLAGLANGLLSREPSKRMFRTIDGTVRAVLSDRYRPRDNWDLLEHLMPVLASYPDVRFRSCDLTDTRLYVKISVPWIRKPITPAVDDVLEGGVIISNSEVGSGSLYIYPWSIVLKCLNGQTHTEFGQRRIHVGRRMESPEEAWKMFSDRTLALDDQAFFAKCADTLRGCLDESVFDSIVDQMRDLAAIRIGGDPVAQVEVLASRQGFNEGERGSILQHLIEGGDLSGWGYLNAVTATARDLDDADRTAELEIQAGKMIADPGWAADLAAA